MPRLRFVCQWYPTTCCRLKFKLIVTIFKDWQVIQERRVQSTSRKGIITSPKRSSCPWRTCQKVSGKSWCWEKGLSRPLRCHQYGCKASTWKYSLSKISFRSYPKLKCLFTPKGLQNELVLKTEEVEVIKSRVNDLEKAVGLKENAMIDQKRLLKKFKVLWI